MRLQSRELHAVLPEHIHDRNLAAERVAPQSRAHLVVLVGIGLNPDRHTGFLQRGHRAGLIAEVGQAHDHAAKLAAMGAQEIGVDFAFLRRLDRAIARGLGVQHQHLVTQRI